MARQPFGRRAFASGFIILVLVAGWWWLARPGVPGTSPTTRGGDLVATVRSEPRSFNRFVARDRTSDLVSQLVHDRLVRINKATQEVEPSLAQAWTHSDDGRTWTVRLRDNAKFSDGTPFTSEDVLFSLAAVYDAKTASPIGGAMLIGDQPLTATAPDPRTVVFTFPSPFGPGIRLLDNLPILPKHRLADALAKGTMRETWTLTTPLSAIAGLGPFVLKEYRPGERLTFVRNANYWARDEDGVPLPRLASLTLLIVPDQSAEMLRLESGETDLVSSEVRPEDMTSLKAAAGRGAIDLHEVGVGLDADFFWFNLKRGAMPPARAWVQSRELRQAISAAVDRRALADTVYLGAAVPIGGPVTPGNREWYDSSIPVPVHDLAAARQLLAAAGLTDKDGNGELEAPDGKPARIALITQKGNTIRERTAAFIQQDLAKVGLGLDVVTLEVPALIERFTTGNFEAAFYGTLASDTDPASNLDFWLSGGAFHPWNPQQPSPATEWEAQIDRLMHEQVASSNTDERKRLFNLVQEIFAREVPAIYFVAPKVTIATSTRVKGVQPGLLHPYVLWNAARLGVK